jgi:VIT1/CCC1 family predicted Fe2+/Mn2+ transporter
MLPKVRIKLVLEPIDRVLEVLGGVIMVLTFTCALSVSRAGEADVREMLIGSLGCNLAWGIIDAIMYLMNCLAARSREHDALRAMRSVRNAEEARQAISEGLPEGVAAVLSPGELERLHVRLRALPEPPARPRLEGDDWLGAAGVFCLVFLSTLPVILPFVLLSEPALALRLSNLIAVCMLFLTGYIFGRSTGHRPLLLGWAMVLVGASLSGVAIALGG